MSSVDDRIVNMKFNNSQFGQGVDKSKRDLVGLEKTIQGAGTSKGMTQLASSVEQTSSKFGVMKIAGVTAIATIANKATNLGLGLLKKFTIQPIMDGFKEYQTGLESVQTIMSNTGRPVKEVNSALLQLNNYADKTIYNFAQMAKNVGTFTAAGVDLKTSVASIKGIANLAALSGSNSQQAATAMYQLSQAISAGKVGLQDWNSVVNAGMGGKIFQTALTRTAMNMGTLNKGAVTFEGTLKRLTVNGQSFRQSISASPGTESYLTGDVLVETLKQISGGYTTAQLLSKGYSKQAAKDIDKLARDAFNAATKIKTLPQLLGVVQESIGSTFAQGFQLILGDFQQSKKLWTSVAYDIIGPHGFITRIQNSFIGMLKGWSENGGRDKVLAGFGRLFKGLGRIAGAFRDAFTEIFPPTTGDQLYRLSKAFKQFALNFRTSKDTAEDLKNIFKGVFAILHIGISIVTAIASGFAAFFGALFDGSEEGRGGILSLLGSVGEAIAAFDKFLTGGGKLTDFMSKLGGTVGSAIAPILAFVGLIVSAVAALVSGQGLGAIAAPIDNITNMFLNFVEGILGGLERITAPFGNISAIFGDLKDKVSGLTGAFASVFSSLGSASGSASGGLSGITGLFDAIVTGAQNLGTSVSNAFNGFMNVLDDIAGASDSVTGKISGSLGAVGDAAADVKNKTGGMYDAVSGAGASAASASIAGVAGAAESAGGIFDGVVATLKSLGGKVADAFAFITDAMSNIPFPDSALDWGLVLNTLISGAIIKKLFFSKGLFASLKDTITDVGDSVVTSFGQLTDTLKTMQTSIKAEMLKNIAISVGILVASLLVLSFIPMKKLGAGLGALATVMSLMGGMLFALGKLDSKINITQLALSLVLMSTSILLMAGAIAALGYLPYEVLAKGFGAMALILGTLVGALFGMAKIQGEIKGMAAAMVVMAIALNLLVFAVASMGLLPYEVLAKGITSIALVLAILVGAMFAFSKIEGEIAGMAASMVVMAIAINMLVFAVAALGILPYEVLAKGIVSIALVLGLLVGAMFAFSLIQGSIEGMAAAMVVMAVGITILAAAIAFLGVLPYEVLAKGLVVVALALGILLAAAFAAQFVAPGLAALSATFIAMGSAMLMAGTGMFLFTTGLAILAAVGAAAIVVISAAIGAFIALLPSIAAAVGAAFVTFIETIAEASPRIRKAFDKIIDNMLQSAQNSFPKIAELIEEALTLAIQILVSFFPAFYEAMWRLVQGLLDSIADHLPDVIDSAYEIAYAIIDGMGKRAVDLANAGADALIEMLNGLSDAVRTKGPLIRSAMGDLAHALGDELRAALSDILGSFDLSSMLPDIHLPKILGGEGNGRRKADPTAPFDGNFDAKKADPLVAALELTGKTVAAAIEGAVGLLVGAMSGPLYDLALGAKKLQSTATYQSTVATSMDQSATTAEEGASARLDEAKNMKDSKKGKGVSQKKKDAIRKAEQAVKLAARQRKAADDAARKASMAQIKADYEAQKSSDAIQYKDDPAGLGDAKSKLGQDLADRSADLLATAQAKAAEIKRLEELAAKGGKNAVKYRQQAAQLRKEAAQETAESMELATQSIQAQEAAVAAYAAARKAAALDAIQRMADIRKQRDDADAQRKWQEAYDGAATDEIRAQMLETRKAANQKIADDATKELNKQLAIGDAIAAKISRGEAVSAEDLAAAEAAAAEAEKQAQIAAAAMDAVEADKQTITQLTTKTAQDNTNGTSTITPSRTATEDAAKAVDRYSASTQQAEEMAGASSSTTQFVQNNYSPEALSASTLYRQGKNLVAAAEFKMGDN